LPVGVDAKQKQWVLLLFQPFIKVALGRTVWNVADVLVSLGLIISLFLKPKKTGESR